MPDRRTASGLSIGKMTVRGAGLAPDVGAALARSVASALAQGASSSAANGLPAMGGDVVADVGAITVRVPASAVGPGGVIDHGAVTEAVARWRAGSAGEGGRHG